MAEFITYRPIGNNVTSNSKARDSLRNWAENNDSIKKFFTVAFYASPYYVSFTPVSANLRNFVLKFTFENNNCTITFTIIYQGTTVLTGSVTGDAYFPDLPFTIFDDGENFVLRLTDGGINFNIGIFTGKTFGGAVQNPVMLIRDCGDSDCAYILHSGSVYTTQLTDAYCNVCRGLGTSYLVSQAQIPGIDMLGSKLYVLDGGGDLPPEGEFLLKGKRYYTVYKNLALRME